LHLAHGAELGAPSLDAAEIAHQHFSHRRVRFAFFAQENNSCRIIELVATGSSRFSPLTTKTGESGY
jgi:hypothetical protein